MTTIVTGFSPEGYREYGKRAVESFCRHWPEEVKLVVYVEQHHDLPARAEQRRMPEACTLFLRRHDENEWAGGRRQKPGHTWKAKYVERGYNFRYDALKFCRMAMFTEHAAVHCKDDFMCWLDGDVVTTADVPSGFIEGLMADHDCIYLGRGKYHSETGFVGFRMPQARDVAIRWGMYYHNDAVFTLPEWHSAYVFDVVRKEMDKGKIFFHDMTPGGKKHVWFSTPLGDYLDHLKGDKRKKQGYSQEKVNR